MKCITLDPPLVEEQAVTFSWSVTPATPLYRRTRTTLRFPESVAIKNVSEAVWWFVFLACLHSHWPLLRPCRVCLPFRLRPGERDLWFRLLQAEANTLDAYRPDHGSLGEVELIETGRPLEPLPTIPASARCGSAFSGGKDSLLSAGLLAEFTRRPVLVSATSPMPEKSDHETARRRYVFAQIAARREILFLEVFSDFRSCYDNRFPASAGYGTSVNEISDTFLYFAALASVAFALELSHLFLASEAEVQQNALRAGVIVQHPHYMYSTVTLRALQALLNPAGIRFSSLTSPLHNAQVQQLLWRRYHDLSELQYSCWRVGPDEITCSRCAGCFRLALCALFVGGNPQRMGINLERLLPAMREWKPRSFAQRDPDSLLPNEVLRPENDRQIVQYIQRVPLRQVMHFLGGQRRIRPIPARTRTALKAYAILRRRLGNFPAGKPLGYRPGFLAQVDPLLREKIAPLYAHYFKPEPEADYSGVLARGNILADWICEPLAHARGN